MKSEFQQQATQKAGTDRPNLTGIPTQMKLNFEQHSGISFDDVRVHYGSDRPAQLRALAYTQGRHVYIGPGQERHLGHELGHVIQQKLGQVAPTGRVGGLPLNDDRRLEAEADRLAGLADRRAPDLEPPVQRAAADPSGEQGVVQRVVLPAFLDQTYSNANTHKLMANARWVQQQEGAAHSDILRASLVGDSHIPDPSDYVDNQAHHIVETNNNPLGQTILWWARIDSDSAVNGVLLPAVSSDYGGDATIHSGPHNNMYGICVTVALWNAVADSTRRLHPNMQHTTPDNYANVITPNSIEMNIGMYDTGDIIDALGTIRRLLLTEHIPFNYSSDGTFGRGDGTVEGEIKAVFKDYNLF